MKKILSLILALLMTAGSAAVFAGCSESTDNSDAGETTGTQNANQTDVQVPAEEEKSRENRE